MEMRKITSGQVRAARGFLDWSIRDLAEKSGVSVNTISRFECGAVDAQLETLLKLREAMEAEGIEFPDDSTVRRPPAPASPAHAGIDPGL